MSSGYKPEHTNVAGIDGAKVWFSPVKGGYMASYRDLGDGPFGTLGEAVRAVELWHRASVPAPFGDVSPAQAHGILPETAPENYGDQIEHWFTYHSPAGRHITDMQAIREAAKALAHVIWLRCPPSADRSAAMRHLREAVMTANASIVLGGK